MEEIKQKTKKSFYYDGDQWIRMDLSLIKVIIVEHLKYKMQAKFLKLKNNYGGYNNA